MCIVYCMNPYAAAATAAAAVCRYRSWSARFQRVIAVGLMAFASMRMHVCAPICLPVCPASYTVVFAVSAWLFIFAVGSKGALDTNRRQLVHELSILVHLDHNIATPCKLAFKKYLWNSWPVECARTRPSFNITATVSVLILGGEGGKSQRDRDETRRWRPVQQSARRELALQSSVSTSNCDTWRRRCCFFIISSFLTNQNIL